MKSCMTWLVPRSASMRHEKACHLELGQDFTGAWNAGHWEHLSALPVCARIWAPLQHRPNVYWKDLDSLSSHPPNISYQPYEFSITQLCTRSAQQSSEPPNWANRTTTVPEDHVLIWGSLAKPAPTMPVWKAKSSVQAAPPRMRHRRK